MKYITQFKRSMIFKQYVSITLFHLILRTIYNPADGKKTEPNTPASQESVFLYGLPELAVPSP